MEKTIIFKNKRGKKLVGIAHVPRKKNPVAVIICHGFQNTKDDKKYIKLGRRLAQKGILAFRFDFEGCGKSEGKLKDLTIANEVFDLDSAVRVVMEKYDIQPEKISFVGGSLGAVIAGLFVKKFKFPVKTLVFFSQGFNQKELTKIWLSKEAVKTILRDGLICTREKQIGKDYYLENRNKDYSGVLSGISFPVLIFQGSADKDVPLRFSKELKRVSKNIVLKILLGANHKFDKPYFQKKVINSTVDWLKKYL